MMSKGHGTISTMMKFACYRPIIIPVLTCSVYCAFLGPNLRSLNQQIFAICGFNISDFVYSGTLKLHSMQNSSEMYI